MKIAIIGAGRVGAALAAAFGRAGHAVTFGVRAPNAAKPHERTIAEASAAAEAVVLAVPFDAAAEVIAAGGGFAGKILIDATNPLGMRDGGLELTMGFDTSGAERIAALAPRAHLFKAFNQTGFENLGDARRYRQKPAMFVAGDNAALKPTVLRLVSDAGFEAIDAGALRAARLLEPLAMLWIELARTRGMGSGFAFALARTA
jgi:predicted dinucleotide-binding enzyme